MRKALAAILVLVLLGASQFVFAQDQAETPEKPEKVAGETQGQFLMRIIRTVNEKKGKADAMFKGTVTEVSASGKLSELGFSPGKGWLVREEVTRQQQNEAYERLVGITAELEATGETDKPRAEEMTSVELYEAIIEAVKEAPQRPFE